MTGGARGPPGAVVPAPARGVAVSARPPRRARAGPRCPIPSARRPPQGGGGGTRTRTRTGWSCEGRGRREVSCGRSAQGRRGGRRRVSAARPGGPAPVLFPFLPSAASLISVSGSNNDEAPRGGGGGKRAGWRGGEPGPAGRSGLARPWVCAGRRPGCGAARGRARGGGGGPPPPRRRSGMGRVRAEGPRRLRVGPPAAPGAGNGARGRGGARGRAPRPARRTRRGGGGSGAKSFRRGSCGRGGGRVGQPGARSASPLRGVKT